MLSKYHSSIVRPANYGHSALKLCGFGLLCAVALACQPTGSQYRQPTPSDDGWQTSSPEREGLDSRLILQAKDKAAKNGKVDALLVARNGKLIVEEYFNGYDKDKTHKVWSITKSVTATLVGIAIDSGFIDSVDDSISRYMGAYVPDLQDSHKKLTISHLLSMTSGIDWEELGGKQSNGYQVAYASDWVAFVLAQPQSHLPGTMYNYSSGNYMLLAPILKNATTEQADEFADKLLFAPLGITNYEWAKYAEFWSETEGGELPSVEKPNPPIQYADRFAGFPNTSSGLKMLPRDLLKLGQLYLNDGLWNGKRVISDTRIKQATQSQFGNPSYGFGWRLGSFMVNGKPTNCYYASGFGLQTIFVFPDFELVIVFTQHNYRTMNEGEAMTQDILNNYLLKAIKH